MTINIGDEKVLKPGGDLSGAIVTVLSLPNEVDYVTVRYTVTTVVRADRLRDLTPFELDQR